MLPTLSRRGFFHVGGAALLGATLTDLWGQAPDLKELPAKRPAERLDGPPLVSAKAWAILDGASGRLLWGANETDALAMASTSKIMTAFLVLDLADKNPKLLDEIVTVSETSAKTGGSTAGLKEGDRFAVKDLLYGLMLPSGNDAAVALAEHCGSHFADPKAQRTPAAAFLAKMNSQAAELRMQETRYVDPHGLGGNRTSARDLGTLAHRALQNALFRQYVQTRRHRCEATDAKGEKKPVTWLNTNRLLEMEGYEGVKTGTTTAAGFCLAAAGRHGDDRLIVIVLGATSNDSRYLDARNLFRWGWNERLRKSS